MSAPTDGCYDVPLLLFARATCRSFITRRFSCRTYAHQSIVTSYNAVQDILDFKRFPTIFAFPRLLRDCSEIVEPLSVNILLLCYIDDYCFLKDFSHKLATMQASQLPVHPRYCHQRLPSGRPASTIYIHTGIGGAGNYHKTIVISPAQSNPSAGPPAPSSRHLQRQQPTTLPRSFKAFFEGGLNGGNLPAPSGMASMIADDECARGRGREARLPVRWVAGSNGIENRRGKERLSSSSSRGEETDRSGDVVAYNGQGLPYGAADVIKWRIGEVTGKMTASCV
jgi:hypothetical protein